MRKPFDKAGPGRPKGSKNRIQASAKEAIEQAAAILGGTERLAQWAREAPENERVFWGSVYPKLLPKDGTITGTFTVNWPLGKSPLDG